ncbi:(2Fe-2S)-binding protein [Corynebacterium sp. CCM 9203]|uniref:(2Fe-2S)-binding protein n=1 Tax=Corynebacterium sp. CCM 9203 TaxID=3057615 RepID=UPI0035244488
MDGVFARLLADHPRFRAAVEPGDGSRPLTVGEAAESDVIERAVAAAGQLFGVSDPRHGGQLWWFSAVNSIVGPSVTVMVGYDCVPDLDLDRGELFLSGAVERYGDPGEGFWIGFTPGRVGAGSAVAWRAAGKDLARSVKPVVCAISRSTGVRSAPLWAVAADGLAQAAVEAGNEVFDPYLGVRVAGELVAGLAAGVPDGVVVPEPRFLDIIGGRIFPTDMAAVSAGDEPDDVRTVVKRASCCMIYHSPTVGKCLSCPRQEPDERERKLLSAFGG